MADVDASNSWSNFAIKFAERETSSSDRVITGSLGSRRSKSQRSPSSDEHADHHWLDSIIGDDDELTALFTRDMPERLICSLIIHARGAVFHGSGWLAGPALVMTCGHNVHHADFGGWAERIDIIPGRAEDDHPFGQTSTTRFSAHGGWVARHDPAADIGCLHLDVSIGDQLGWFAIAQLGDPGSLVGQPITCAGYPEYDGDFTRQRRGDGVVAAIANTRIYHTADTNNGESGGPIWLAANGDTPPTAIGVHTYEKIVLAGPLHQEANSGTLIDDGMLALIDQWRNAMPA